MPWRALVEIPGEAWIRDLQAGSRQSTAGTRAPCGECRTTNLISFLKAVGVSAAARSTGHHWAAKLPQKNALYPLTGHASAPFHAEPAHRHVIAFTAEGKRGSKGNWLRPAKSRSRWAESFGLCALD